MLQLLACLQCILLLAIVYQDFRFRALSVYLLAGTILITLSRTVMAMGWEQTLTMAGFNLLLITIQVLGVVIYFSLKNRKVVNIINTYLGSGDLLFFVILLLSFSPANFIAFNLMSYLVILIIFAIVQQVKGETYTIPLAGCLAVFLCITILLNQFNQTINPYSDYDLIKFTDSLLGLTTIN